MSDWQTYINTGATIVLAAVGWLVKVVRDDIKEHGQAVQIQAAALQNFRLKVAEEYVTHSDLGDIKATLRRIEDKLDNKADK